MKRVVKLLFAVTLIAVIVFFHVSLMEYIRGYFAFGSEWLIYGIITFFLLCWAGGVYEKVQSKEE